MTGTTNVDLGSVVLSDAVFEDATLKLAAGDLDLIEGTILSTDTGDEDKYIAYVKGTNNPTAVLTYAVTLAAAGDTPVRVAVAGRMRKEKLVIAADGDDSNIDQSVKNALRQYAGIVAVEVEELNIQDNQ